MYTSPAYVGGGQNNTASGLLSTISGGDAGLASGSFASVGGGSNNTASGPNSTIAGGLNNMATKNSAVVGGGLTNSATGAGSTVGGGQANTASATWATVSGGQLNTASADHATVPGGLNNTASGTFSLAAGRGAQAAESGSFVWGDGVVGTKASTGANTFSVYASGGASFFSDAAATTGVELAPGSGTWSTLSDRASKENLSPVDSLEILSKVSGLPIATWNYISQGQSVRHMGPMAQDFREAFGLGVSPERIDTVDPDGVALAAIQGLHQLLLEKGAEVDELQARIDRLEAILQSLQASDR